MKASVLAEAMGHRLNFVSYQLAAPGINLALAQAECTTVDRAAMMLAQARHESGGLYYTCEAGDASYLEAKQYYPYIGGGYIQCTWETNYADFGDYCHAQLPQLVAYPGYFVDHPNALQDDRTFAALTLPWYWRRRWSVDSWTPYPSLNDAADHQDVVCATHMINGGESHLSDRQAYFDDIRALGDAILPSDPESEAMKKLLALIQRRNGIRDWKLRRLNDRLRALEDWKAEFDKKQQ